MTNEAAISPNDPAQVEITLFFGDDAVKVPVKITMKVLSQIQRIFVKEREAHPEEVNPIVIGSWIIAQDADTKSIVYRTLLQTAINSLVSKKALDITIDDPTAQKIAGLDPKKHPHLIEYSETAIGMTESNEICQKFVDVIKSTNPEIRSALEKTEARAKEILASEMGTTDDEIAESSDSGN